MIDDAEKLARAEQFITNIMVTGSRVKAAKSAGISVARAREWEAQEWFGKLLAIRRERYSSIGVEQVGALFAQAVEVMTEAMHEDQPIHMRLKAAEKILSFSKRSAADAGATPVISLSAHVSGSDASDELKRRRIEASTSPLPSQEDEDVDF